MIKNKKKIPEPVTIKSGKKGPVTNKGTIHAQRMHAAFKNSCVFFLEVCNVI